MGVGVSLMGWAVLRTCLETHLLIKRRTIHIRRVINLVLVAPSRNNLHTCKNRCTGQHTPNTEALVLIKQHEHNSKRTAKIVFCFQNAKGVHIMGKTAKFKRYQLGKADSN